MLFNQLKQHSTLVTWKCQWFTRCFNLGNVMARPTICC